MTKHDLCHCGKSKQIYSAECLSCSRNHPYRAQAIRLTTRGRLTLLSTRLLFSAPCHSCKRPVDVTLHGPVEHGAPHRCIGAVAA